MKVLKYVGKGLWEEIDEKEVISTDKTQPVKKTKHTPASRLALFFETVGKDIREKWI